MNHAIVHGNCYDGFGAAWVIRKATDAVIHFGIYGSPIPDVPPGSNVWMVDISYPRPMMDALAQRVNLRVLDHHKTAQANLEGFPNCVFDMNRSGAMLAWNEFFPGERAPKLIQYIQDQDLWTWKLPDSYAICSYIRSFDKSFEDWDYLDAVLYEDFNACRSAGMAIMRSEAQRVVEMCQQVRWMEIGGHRVPVVNATTQMSAIGHRLCEMYPEASFSAYYLDRADGKRQWGLRSLREFDVSVIAKQYGGGGHRNASGFETLLENFRNPS